MIDWYPTVAAMAGLPPAKMENTGPMPVDGKDMWSAIKSGSASPRTEMVHSKCRLPWRLLSSKAKPQRSCGLLRQISAAATTKGLGVDPSVSATSSCKHRCDSFSLHAERAPV